MRSPFSPPPSPNFTLTEKKTVLADIFAHGKKWPVIRSFREKELISGAVKWYFDSQGASYTCIFARYDKWFLRQLLRAELRSSTFPQEVIISQFLFLMKMLNMGEMGSR